MAARNLPRSKSGAHKEHLQDPRSHRCHLIPFSVCGVWLFVLVVVKVEVKVVVVVVVVVVVMVVVWYGVCHGS